MQHYGATAVLCTATQPALGKWFKQLAPTLVQREIVPNPDELFEFFKRVSFVREGVLPQEELAARLMENGAGPLHRQYEKTRKADLRDAAGGRADSICLR